MTMNSTAQPAAQPMPIPAAAAGDKTTTRRFSMNRRQRGIVIRQVLLQIFLLFMLITVLFPVLWIVSMAIDPRGVARPTDLNLIPANANLEAFRLLLTTPFSNTFNVYFGQLLMNSLFIALGVSVFTVLLGSSAAYAFSRFRFMGRELGMLAFILLLLLPSTGVIIPLYVMFNSVQMSSTVAEFFPALFSGILVGVVVYLIYSMVRAYGKKNPDRAINIPHWLLAVLVAGGALAAILLTITVMFVRSPIYVELVAVPLEALDTAVNVAQAEVNQRQQSVEQRSTTASRREDRAAAAEEAAAFLQEAQFYSANANNPEDAVAIYLQARISEREALSGGSADDPVLAALQLAYAQFQIGGKPAAADSLQASLATAQETAAAARETATSARANADEATTNLSAALTALAQAQAEANASMQQYLDLRNGVLLTMLPYLLLVWAGALVVAGAIWFVVKLLSSRVPPHTAIMALLLLLIIGLVALFTYSTLQYRLTLVRSDQQTLRTTLLGLALAFSSAGLPFAIWNLKGYFDTIPKELEEAARIDGANRLQTFIRVMVPLAMPAFAIVILFSFMNGWTEFILSWIFMTGQTQNYTLAMALATLTGGANQPPPDMQKFAALAILISLPILVLFFSFQRFIVGGLSLGGVKG